MIGACHKNDHAIIFTRASPINYSNVEFKNCNRSCLFASRSSSPFSLRTLSLICNGISAQRGIRGVKEETNPPASEHTPSLVLLLAFLVLALLVLPAFVPLAFLVLVLALRTTASLSISVSTP